MEEKESGVKVYFSKEYGAFKHIVGNRDIRQSKINKLLKAIKEGHDYLSRCPILASSRSSPL